MTTGSQDTNIRIDKVTFYKVIASGNITLDDAKMFIFKEPEPLPRVKTMAERSVRASTKTVKPSSTVSSAPTVTPTVSSDPEVTALVTGLNIEEIVKDQPTVHLLPLNYGSDFSLPEKIMDSDSRVGDLLNTSQESITRFTPLKLDQSTSSGQTSDFNRQSILTSPGPVIARTRPTSDRYTIESDNLKYPEKVNNDSIFTTRVKQSQRDMFSFLNYLNCVMESIETVASHEPNMSTRGPEQLLTLSRYQTHPEPVLMTCSGKVRIPLQC